jgi:hypothetical protein
MRLTALLAALVLLTTGCKKKDKAANDEPAAEGSTTDLTSDRSMQVMNAYVELFNGLLDAVPDTLDNYWEHAGDKPLTVDTMTKWGNVICAGAGWMKMNREQSKDQVEKIERLSSGEFAKMPPLAEAMYAAGVAYVDQRDAMCTYVKGGQFKDDQGAKATELHDGIVKARDLWNAAVDALAAELDRVQDAQATAELAKHEADKSYGYWFRFTTIRANELLRLARRDPVKAEATIVPLEQALAGFNEFVKAKGAGVNETFAGYAKQVDRFAATTAKLKPALAAAKTPAAKAAAIDAVFDDLVSAYNTMISLHNVLIEAEARGDLK